MIETVHQAPGRFGLAFDNPPEEIRKLTARAFAALIVTPAPLARGDDYRYSDLLAMASYVGVVTGRSDDRTKISGYGPAYLLGLAKQDAAASVVARPLYDGSNPSWIRNFVLRLTSSENNGITVGTIASSASPTKTGKVLAGATPLSVLNDVCRRFSVEWRVNPAGTLDVAAQATLYPTATTPTAIATPKGGSRDLSIVGLSSVDFNEQDDWDTYTTTVTCNDDTAGTHSGTSSLGSVPYVNPYTSAAILSRRVVTSTTADTNADCATIAAQQLGRFDQVQRELTMTTDVYTISDSVDAGDYIWAFDPDNDLYDTTNEITYQGRPVWPVKVRVHAVQDACSAEKGYYLYSWNGTAMELCDLTPLVAFEDHSVSLELGEPRRLRPPTPTLI